MGGDPPTEQPTQRRAAAGSPAFRPPPAAAAALLYPARRLWRLYADAATALHAGPRDLRALIAAAAPTGRRVAVIGAGISGVQAMKACLAEGIEPTCFEADSDVGGFWRFKEGSEHPSVYRSTHIDTDRDVNSFGDRPWDAEAPLLIHNGELTRYLRQNIAEFGLAPRIRLSAHVALVTPVGDHARGAAGWGKGGAQWEVHYTAPDPADPAAGRVRRVEAFDGVLVCTGRHGGGGFMPRLRNQEKFRGVVLHSSQYKYPEKHGLVGKDCVVVGVGNSGCDIVTELGMLNGGGMRNGGGAVVNPDKRSTTYIVARSGGWVGKAPHMEVASAALARDSVAGNLMMRLPWWWRNAALEKQIAEGGGQAQLNRHGMAPAHRRMQQHDIVSGLAGQVFLGDQLDRGWIVNKRGINAAKGFSEDGAGIWLNDRDGTPDAAPTPCGAVIFATGFRQQAGFVDPKVVDMRYEREGNDVPLFKGCVPIGEYFGIGFVNFIQSGTFPCAELQCRYLTRVFKGLIRLPPAAAQRAEMAAARAELAARFIDRQQLRVQHGIDGRYYQDLAHEIGCYPTPWRILTQRPTALWHAFFTGIGQIPNRLVGPGRLEAAEGWIEERYRSRHYGPYKDAGGEYDHNPLKGQPKNGGGDPANRPAGWFYAAALPEWRRLSQQLWRARREGYAVGPVPYLQRPQRLGEQLAQNLEHAKADAAAGIGHSLRLNSEVRDGYLDAGGERQLAFANRASRGEGGLAAGGAPAPAAAAGDGAPPPALRARM